MALESDRGDKSIDCQLTAKFSQDFFTVTRVTVSLFTVFFVTASVVPVADVC